MNKANRKKLNLWLVTLLGLMLITGAVLLLIFPPSELPAPGYIALGLGCGLMGGGGSGLLAMQVAKNNPEQAQQIEIEGKDERNIAIKRRAKAVAFSFGFYAYCAILLLFALLGIPAWAVLTLCGGYLLTIGVYLFFLVRYQKTM